MQKQKWQKCKNVFQSSHFLPKITQFSFCMSLQWQKCKNKNGKNAKMSFKQSSHFLQKITQFIQEHFCHFPVEWQKSKNAKTKMAKMQKLHKISNKKHYMTAGSFLPFPSFGKNGKKAKMQKQKWQKCKNVFSKC